MKVSVLVHNVLQASMTPTQALSLLYATKDWSTFQIAAVRVKLAVNLQCLENLRHQTLEELPESFVDVMYATLTSYVIMHVAMAYALLAVAHQCQMHFKHLFPLEMETAFITACLSC